MTRATRQKVVDGLWVMLWLSVVAPPAWATDVGGPIITDTTWTLAGSPYVVTSTVEVSNAILSIEPGVTIRFNQHTGLVLGLKGWATLRAQGTPEALIVFTANSETPTRGFWNGITFYRGGPAISICEYCVIEYGGADDFIGHTNIFVDEYAGPTIQHSMIRYSSGYGLLFSDKASVALLNNTFAHNVYPLRVQLPHFPQTFVGNLFVNNDVQAILLDGTTLNDDFTIPAYGIPYRVTSHITVRGSTSSSSPTLTLLPGTTLQFNANTGLRVGSASSSRLGVLNARGTAAQPIVLTGANATPGFWNGVTFSDTSPASLCDYCVIEYGGAGTSNTNVWIASSGPAIQHSTIRHSDGDGIVVTAGASPTLGRSNITNNALAALNSAGMTMASLNWWGDASGPSGIGPGSGGLMTGTAVFEPWLGEPPTQPFEWVEAVASPDPFTQAGGWITFFGTLSEEGHWTITMTNSVGTPVKTFTGAGTSVEQDWAGEDDTGAALADGIYPYRFDATSLSTGQAAAPVIGQVTLTETLAIADLTSPVHNQILPGGATIDIRGTAAGTTFQSYNVKYGSGVLPSSWTQLISSTTPVTHGVLASWDTASLRDPTYTIRLTVTNTSNAPTSTERRVSMDYLTITEVSASPTVIDPVTGEPTTLNYSLSHPADVTIRFYQFLTKMLQRTLTFFGRPVGTNTVIWDGTDDAGTVLPLEAYYFTIEAADPEGRIGTFNDALNPSMGPTPATDNRVVDATTFDPYQNSTVSIGYSLSTLGRLTVQLIQPTGAVIRTLLNQAIRTRGSHVEGWDGRRDDGWIYQGDFNVYFGAPTALPKHAIILSHPALDFIDFRTEAYLIQPVFHEVSVFSYTLTQPATVSITLTDPNGNQIRTLRANVPQQAGPQSVEWDGCTDAGSLVSVEGVYKVTLTVVDPSSGFSVTRFGAITVYR